MLHKRGSVDEAQRAVAEGQPVHEFISICVFRIYRDEPDALSGERKVFRVGRRRDAANVVLEDVRVLKSIEQYLSVWLVAHEEDLNTKFCLLVSDHFTNLGEQATAVEHARRIVRGTREDDTGLRTDDPRQEFEIGEKLLIRRDDLARSAVVVCVEEVLDEVRSEDDHLVARIENGAHHYVERPSSPDRHEYLIRSEG